MLTVLASLLLAVPQAPPPPQAPPVKEDRPRIVVPKIIPSTGWMSFDSVSYSGQACPT
jgi:hypothetical protein